MDDALRHWWVNFGHAQMPNGQPYNPCEEDENGVSVPVPAQDRVPVSPSSDLTALETPIPSQNDTVSSGNNDWRTQLPSSKSLGTPQFQRPRRHSLDGQCPFPLGSGEELCVQPPAIIHQRNQSSLSSDSDAELEFFRSPRWGEQTQVQPERNDEKLQHSLNQQQHLQQQQQQRKRGWRFGLQKTAVARLDSTGNSVNSSGSASPANNTEEQDVGLDLEGSRVHRRDEGLDDSLPAKGQDERPHPSNVLKLPPALFDILGGCSEKSLAMLLSPDLDSNIVSFNPFGLLDDYNKNGKSINGSCATATNVTNSAISNQATSSSLDLRSVPNANDATNNNIHSSSSMQPVHTSHTPTTAPSSCSVTTTSSITDSFVFDSERKPKRSILKRRGKFSGGGDAGEKAGDAAKDLEDDGHIPKSGGGHLPRRLPSFRDEAHGIFASKHRASQLLEEASGTLAPESCSSALLSHHTPWGRHAGSSADFSVPCPGQIAPVPQSSAEYSSSVSVQRNHTADLTSSSQPNSLLGQEPFPAFSSAQQAANVPTNLISDASLTSHEERGQSPLLTSADHFQHQNIFVVEGDHHTETASHSDLSQICAHNNNSIDADVANGNPPKPAVHEQVSILIEDGILSLTHTHDPTLIVGVKNGGLLKAKDDSTPLASALDLSPKCPISSSLTCDPNPAKSYSERVSDSVAATVDGECSANYSPTRSITTKHTSANISNRSSASNSSGDSAYESSSLSSYPSTPSISSFSSSSSNTSTTTKVVRRSGNIMKASQLEQARNRLSVSSIGSNSSADILDLSYDSGDSDHFVNLESQSVQRTSSPENRKVSDQAFGVEAQMSMSDACIVPLEAPVLRATLDGSQGSKIQELPQAQNNVSNLTLIDMEFSDFTGLPGKVCHKPSTSLPEDVDLIVFPDDEENDIQGLEVSNKSADASCNIYVVEDNASLCSHQTQLTPTPLPESLNSHNLDSFDDDKNVTPGESNLTLTHAAINGKQCLETIMASLDVGPQAQVEVKHQGSGSHQGGVEVEESEQVLKITEAGSPLLYRLTREAQTWL